MWLMRVVVFRKEQDEILRPFDVRAERSPASLTLPGRFLRFDTFEVYNLSAIYVYGALMKFRCLDISRLVFAYLLILVRDIYRNFKYIE